MLFSDFFGELNEMFAYCLDIHLCGKNSMFLVPLDLDGLDICEIFINDKKIKQIDANSSESEILNIFGKEKNLIVLKGGSDSLSEYYFKYVEEIE